MAEVTKEVIRKEITSMSSSAGLRTGRFGGAGAGYMQVLDPSRLDRDRLRFRLS